MDPENGSSEPRPGEIKSCRACYQPISAGSKFCPTCGANQYPTMELEQRMDHAARSWPPVRNAIIFYLVYLGSVVPIIWLPGEDIASGLIVVSIVDVVIILVYWSIARVPLGPVLKATPEAWRWSGIALAVLVGAGLAALSSQVLPETDHVPIWLGVVCGFLFATVGQFGDLTMSLFKRGAGIKDSSSILPGLGGVLDVLDSPLMVAPVAFWVLHLAT